MWLTMSEVKQETLSEEELMAQEAANAALDDEEYVLSEDDTSSTSDTSGTSETEQQYNETQAMLDKYNSATGRDTSLGSDFLSGLTNDNGVLGAVDRIGITAVEGGIASGLIGKVTGHTWLGRIAGYGGVILLQQGGILPKSFSTVKEYVSNLFNGGTEAETSEVTGETVNSMQTDASTLTSVTGSMSSQTEAISGMGEEGTVNISDAMYESGAMVAKSGALNLAAHMNDISLGALNQMSSETMEQMVKKVSGLESEDGTLSDANKTDVVNELKALMDGYEAYGNGALTELSSVYAEDTESYEEGVAGLSSVLQQQTTPFYQAVQSLDEKYGLLSEEDKAYFDEKAIVGMSSYSDFVNGVTYDDVSEETETEAEETVSVESETETEAEIEKKEDSSLKSNRPVIELDDDTEGPTVTMEME